MKSSGNGSRWAKPTLAARRRLINSAPGAGEQCETATLAPPCRAPILWIYVSHAICILSDRVACSGIRPRDILTPLVGVAVHIKEAQVVRLRCPRRTAPGQAPQWVEVDPPVLTQKFYPLTKRKVRRRT